MIFSIILVIYVIFLLKYFKISALSPSGIFSIIWILFIILSLLFLSGQYEFEYWGICWILVAVSLFIFGDVFANKKIKKKAIPKKEVYIPHIPWGMVICFIILSFLNVLYIMMRNGISFNVFSNIASLQETSHGMAVARYTEENNTTIVGQVLGTFSYVAPISCGYSYNFTYNKREKLICIFSFFPVLLSLLLTNAKLGMVSFVILFFVGYYISYIYLNKTNLYINIKIVGLSIIAAFVFGGLFYLSFYLRIGEANDNVFGVIIRKLAVYAFGHIQSFDVWFSSHKLKMGDLKLGMNTFLAISSILGLEIKVQGIYGLIPGACSNVFSYFRGIIEDYGYLFSHVIIFILGAIISYCFNKIKNTTEKCVFIQWVLSVLLFGILYFMVSPWVYTSYYVTFIVFGFFLYWTFHYNIRFKFK